MFIGNKKESVELFALFESPQLPITPPTLLLFKMLFNSSFEAKLHLKFKCIDKGENILFKNIAISSFIGTSIKLYEYGEGLYDNAREATDKTSYMFCIGSAVGTRKKIDDFSYFEIFTSPQISLTYYDKLGGGMFDPANFLLGYKYEKFGLWIPDFSLPVGVGFKYRYFIVNTGTAFSTTIGSNTRRLNRDGALIDKVVFESNKFSFFAELGIHFRKFKQL
jgi:hypothetical protein